MLLTSARARMAFERLKPFLALSRTPHGLLDMAMPVAVAILWLGAFPPLGVAFLGLFTVFAGYTAVYAVNDLADYKTDRESFLEGPADNSGYLDAVYARHPLAMGLVTRRDAYAWTAAWAVAALAGAYILNPVCAYLMLAGCALEAAYCRLLKVTHLRALLNGVVKALGSLAAVLAVDPAAPLWFLVLTLAMLFCWEIGGQNIPADWFDLEPDRRRGARTLCVTLGLDRAAKVSLATLSAATALAAVMLLASPGKFPLWVTIAATGVNAWLMPCSAGRLSDDPTRDASSRLFTRASYFPVVMLGAAVTGMIVR
jgi:4-hydroxybenzoate polyprenyltransferase